jgi:serine O-acetyltransferase
MKISKIIWLVYYLSVLLPFGLGYLFTFFNRFFFGIYISPLSKVDKSVIFHYQGLGIVIGRNSVINKNVEIGQNTTIGGRYSKSLTKEGYPVIEQNCFIGPNSLVLGPITVGENSIIGCNSTVLISIESNSIYAGSPVRKIRTIKKRILGDKYE